MKRLPLLYVACFMDKYKSLHVGQLPQEHLSFLQNLLNFIITKYLKQEVEDDLSIYVNERGSCDLSITGDIKIYQCHMIMLLAPMEKCLTSTKELFLQPKFDNSRSRDLSKSCDYEVMTSPSPEVEDPMRPSV